MWKYICTDNRKHITLCFHCKFPQHVSRRNLIQHLQTFQHHILQYPYLSTVRIIIPFYATKPHRFSLNFYEEEEEKIKEKKIILYVGYMDGEETQFLFFRPLHSCTDYSHKRLKIPNYQTLINVLNPGGNFLDHML